MRPPHFLFLLIVSVLLVPQPSVISALFPTSSSLKLLFAYLDPSSPLPIFLSPECLGPQNKAGARDQSSGDGFGGGSTVGFPEPCV